MINCQMEAEARLNGGVPIDGSFSFKNCYSEKEEFGIITLSYKDPKGSEHLVVRPLNDNGMDLALAAKEDALKNGRIVLW